MLAEPADKRAVAFFDGQNLFFSAREAFGIRYPDYDPVALARAVCAGRGWSLAEVRFYTGVPDVDDSTFWNHFWTAKLAQMGRVGVHTYSRPLRYRHQTVRFADGSEHSFLVAQEKGIDVRVALDIVRLAQQRLYDVALVFSQDQDLSEVADEIRTIAVSQERWIKIASAFPTSPTVRNRRGVNGTDWIPVDRHTYESCRDLRDYRPRRS